MQKFAFMLKINIKYSQSTKTANGKCRMSFANQIPSFRPLNKTKSKENELIIYFAVVNIRDYKVSSAKRPNDNSWHDFMFASRAGVC